MFCYERDFILSPSGDKQAGIIEAFNTTSSYSDDILNINHTYFDCMVSQIYPSQLKLNQANTAYDEEAAFLYLHLSISNSIAYTKYYDKRDEFPILDGAVPRSTSCGVYISQLTSAKLYDKRDDFDLENVNFPFLDAE